MNKDLGLESQSIVTAVLESRLLPQWRKGKLRKKMEHDMLASLKEIWLNGREFGNAEGLKSLTEQYKDFIPKPKATFRKRIKFLFLGKF